MLSLLNTLQPGDWGIGYLLAYLGLTVFWAVENFFVQALLFECPPITAHPLPFQMVRLAINLLAAGLVVLVCNRTLLLALIGLDFAVSLLVVAYKQYFHRAFSLCYTLKNYREGLKVSSFAARIIPRGVWLGLVGALVIKAALGFAVTPGPPTAQFHPNLVGIALPLLALALLVVALQYTSFCFVATRGMPITRAVYVYGYAITWIAEFFIAPDTREVAREVAELQKESPDRLAAVEAAWPVGGHIVVVQLESFGWNSLHCKIEGREVTPYINRLAHSGRVFKLQAYHDVGSADMDYAALSGGTPSKRMSSYFVPGLQYDRALPRFLQQHGYRTISLHGVSGDFYNRRTNFERMGFDEILFREQFQERPLKYSYWGLRDQEVFRRSAQKMRVASRPEFHFLISLDTHGPFNLIADEEKVVFPGSNVWQENYFNSLAVLDRNVREYVSALPAGTLVILYGDHTAGFEYHNLRPARAGAAEFVPCVVHVCQGPETWPATVEPQALPDDLRIQDIMNFLRRQVALTRHPAAEPALAAK